MSNNQATSSVSTYVPILDGTNYREWSAQMCAYLRSVGYWLIFNGTTTVPTDPVELQKWTLSDLMANGAIELRCSLNIRDLIGTTSTATWTALSTTFGAAGVSCHLGPSRQSLSSASVEHNTQGLKSVVSTPITSALWHLV